MKKINLFILVLAICSVTSCKNAIDVAPVSAITSSSFFKTEDDVSGALRGMYFQLRIPAASDLYFMGEGRSDILTSATAGTTGLDKYYENTLNVTNPGPNWQTLYTVINTANLILKYTPAINFVSESAKNNALAQAYTMRAYVYFCMVRTWGGVPIRTEPTEKYNPSGVQLARSTTEQVFALVKDDITKAISLYADNTIDPSRSFWNKPSANALKGEIYLWTGKMLNGGMADFTISLNALQDVPTVTLLPNYSDIFSYTNKKNQEVLTSVRFQLLDGAPQNYWANMYVSTLSNVPPSTVAFIGALGVGNTGNNIMQIAPTVRTQFSTDDQRRNATFFEIYDNANKYVTSVTVKGRGVVDGGSRQFYTDVTLYRYADVLLMMAEAKNALSQDPSIEMNLIRKRAYGLNFAAHLFVNGSKVANDTAILQERLLEFCTEGKRWWDLVRFGQAFNLVPSLQGKQADNYLLLFPIGATIRSLEPLVEENPGWK